MKLLRAIFDYWASPDNDPWLIAARSSLDVFKKNHPHIAKGLQSPADNTATTNYKPERHHD
jgi:hypothetical protein